MTFSTCHFLVKGPFVSICKWITAQGTQCSTEHHLKKTELSVCQYDTLCVISMMGSGE